MRLIDADKLLDRFYKALQGMFSDEYGNHPVGFKLCIEAVKKQETVDAVKVVRCKDCYRKPTCKHTRSLGINGYCSEGERKEAT